MTEITILAEAVQRVCSYTDDCDERMIRTDGLDILGRLESELDLESMLEEHDKLWEVGCEV